MKFGDRSLDPAIAYEGEKSNSPGLGLSGTQERRSCDRHVALQGDDPITSTGFISMGP